MMSGVGLCCMGMNMEECVTIEVNPRYRRRPIRDINATNLRERLMTDVGIDHAQRKAHLETFAQDEDMR